MVFEGVTDFIKSLYYCDLLLETTTVAPLTVAVPEKWWCVLTLVVELSTPKSSSLLDSLRPLFQHDLSSKEKISFHWLVNIPL